MLRVCSIILEVIAGFFLFMVTLLAFMSGLSAGWKLMSLGLFLLPAVVVMAIGLALTRFRYWKRDTGVVLLTVTSCTLFIVFTMACMIMSEEFRKLLIDGHSDPFSSYAFGTTVNAALAALGWYLVKKGGDKAESPSTLQPV
jgi:hypothetical protein